MSEWLGLEECLCKRSEHPLSQFIHTLGLLVWCSVLFLNLPLVPLCYLALAPLASVRLTSPSTAAQVASQSAVSQEQVDHILQENDALRTSLAALEQVTPNI